MAFISTTTIAKLKTVQDTAMPSTLVHKRPVWASDGQGGQTPGSTMTVGTYAGRVFDSGVREIETEIAGQIRSVQTYTVAVPSGTTILADDYFETGGATLRVIGAAAPLSYETASRALCVKVLP